ncbi:MAG: phytoene desaturase family protein [Bacteroidales bacterium]|nr:phytoene desaturase family protein [Bacteroidales bacterium]MDT8373196.1 phytoene desaturase family protein [Bacteroidales bacterium]
MADQRSALVIGAGIAGIATSLLLAQKGYMVDVYEKNISAGGRCGNIIRDGHRFDVGATMMLMPEVYREVFSEMGLDLDVELPVRPLDDIYTLQFDDGTSLSFTTDPKRMEKQLEKIESGSYSMAVKYVKTGFGLYKEAFDRLLGRNFTGFFEFFNLSNALLLIKLKTYVNHYRYTSRFFRSEHLRMAFTFQNIYVGQSPFSAPALFSMIPAAELSEGSMFPAGGMYAVAEKLMAKAVELGVSFHFARPVTRILVDKKRATGVLFSDGSEARTDIIVANADLPYVYRKLLPRKGKSRRIERMKFSCSALVLHWALDRQYSQLGHHTTFLADNFREGLDTIFRDKSMGDDPCFYIHAPVRSDPSAAPEGCDTLSVAVGVGHLDPGHQEDWNLITEKARSAVFRKLKTIGIEDIEEHIKFEIVATPATWEEALNITRGSVFGSLGHNILQMGWFRPHNRDRRYRNLYFTGGSTHPGNGIPMVLLSAKLVSERIVNEQKQQSGRE